MAFWDVNLRKVRLENDYLEVSLPDFSNDSFKVKGEELSFLVGYISSHFLELLFLLTSMYFGEKLVSEVKSYREKTLPRGNFVKKIEWYVNKIKA